MSRLMFSEIHRRDQISKHPSMISPIPSPASTAYHQKYSSFSTISPVLLLVISVLALVIVSLGILHLLLRFLSKSPTFSHLYNSNPNPDVSSFPHVLQGQLRQLFLLHDSGLDQSAIDALPVFCYRDIIMGLKEPFDCAVCLCEFSDMDNLRLLPACSHAFHVYCIDTWLLSNSTCPLCRSNLSNPTTTNFDSTSFNNTDFNSAETVPISTQMEESKPFESKRVFSVRLGKFRSTNERQIGQDQGQGQSPSQSQESTVECGLGSRRCYSMGTHQYLEWDQDFLVALSPSQDGKIGNNSSGCQGNKSVKKLDSPIEGGASEKRMNGRFSKNESISVSKVWLWSKKSNNTLLHNSSSSPSPIGLFFKNDL